MAVRAKISPAAALLDPAFRGAAMKGNMSARAQLKLFNGDIYDETLGRGAAGKPGGPNLKMPARCRLRRNLDVVYEQIPEPPRAAAIRQAATHEPDLVSPPHVRRGVNGVEFSAVQGCSFA